MLIGDASITAKPHCMHLDPELSAIIENATAGYDNLLYAWKSW